MLLLRKAGIQGQRQIGEFAEHLHPVFHGKGLKPASLRLDTLKPPIMEHAKRHMPIVTGLASTRHKLRNPSARQRLE